MPKLSAGLLLYRRAAAGVEVFLVHPGGPFWAKKDEAGWSVPKGLVEPGEDAATAARREFGEEVGLPPPGQPTLLGTLPPASGKTIIVFALEGDFDPAKLKSNLIEIDWPPRSGRRLTIPEVDSAAWFDLDTATIKLHIAQRPVIELLRRHLNFGQNEGT